MTYGKFAYLYDQLMNDVPYELWMKYIKKKLEKYGHDSKRILDLACGTGELSVRLAEEGFEVTGVDLSEDMLSVAAVKAEKAGVTIPYYQQNMTELEGFSLFDCVIVFCDSINYLQTENEVKLTFQHIYNQLIDEGLFLFDAHSVYKIDHIFLNQTFTRNDDEISYIWDCFPGSLSNSVEHDLSFFVQDERNGLYQRYDETHVQRTFSVEQYAEWLTETGFKILDISADFKEEVPTEFSERIFFTLKK